MEIKEKTEHCSCCGRKCEFHYGIENFNPNSLDLESYKNYKDIYVYKCSNCGFISTDLSGSDSVFYAKVKDTDEFKNALSYAYLNGVNEELYENHSKAVPANTYDAYTVMMKASDNKEMYLRALNHTIELKDLMLQKYQFDSENEYDEEENEIFEELEDLIYENIDESRELFIDEVTNDENSNVFLHLMAVENLCEFEEYKEAKSRFSKIKQQIKLNNDLIKYFENLLNNSND